MTTDDERSAVTDASAPDDRDTTTRAEEAAPPPRPRRLVRLEDGAPGAGVAAGLGAYFGVDPVLFRLAFVVLAFAGGVGVILYLAGWIAMPKGTADDVAGPPPAPPDRTTQWLVIGLAAAAGLLLLVRAPFAGPWPGWGGPFVWAVALIVLGVVLFRWDAGRRAGGTQPAPAATERPGAAPPPSQAPSTASVAGTAPPPPPAAPAAYALPPRPPQPGEPPSLLGRFATGIGLLLLGLAALLDNVGALRLAAYHYVALALAVTGVALVVGAWWGRARGLIVVGLLLLPLLVATSLFAGFGGRNIELGERQHRPLTVAEMAERYRLGAGELEIDLTALAFDDEDVRLDVAVGAGDVLVVVPDDINVVVEASTGAGELELFDLASNGINVRRSVTYDGDPNAPTLEVEARAGVGRVRVLHGDPRLMEGLLP